MTGTEVVKAEVVDPKVELDRPAQEPSTGALDRAAEAALAMPGVPGRDEFLSLAMQARILAMSGAAPKLVRGDPYVAFHVAMVGRDLGISPSAAIELIDVMETGGQARLSLSPQLLNGQLRRLKLGSIVPLERTTERAVALAVGPGGLDQRCRRTGRIEHVDDCDCDVLGTSEFTWEDAREAGLVGAQCTPGNHPKTMERGGRNGRPTYKVCGCNQGYITYPKRMLWWRASGFAADDYFPEAGLGLYSPEALGAVVDEEGRPIDPSTVELPPGYHDPQAAQREQQQRMEQPADPDELWALQERIAALPDGVQQDLRRVWTGPESRLRGVPARAVPRRLIGLARAMVNGHMAQAASAGVDMDQQLQTVRVQTAGTVLQWLRWAASGGADTAEALSGPETTSEEESAPTPPDGTPEDHTDAQGGQSGEAEAGPEPELREVDWRPLLRSVADEVRTIGADVPKNVVERITDEVRTLHPRKVNSELAEAGLTEAFPPTSPIDLRRMRVAQLRLEAFKAAGVVPGGGDT